MTQDLSAAQNKAYVEARKLGLSRSDALKVARNLIETGPRNNGRIRGGVEAKRLRQRIKKRDGFKCHYCDKYMKQPVPDEFGTLEPDMATLEHVVPKCLGGTRQLFNLVLAHSKCNNDRADQLIKCLCKFCCNAREQLGEGIQAKRRSA